MTDCVLLKVFASYELTLALFAHGCYGRLCFDHTFDVACSSLLITSHDVVQDDEQCGKRTGLSMVANFEGYWERISSRECFSFFESYTHIPYLASN